MPNAQQGTEQGGPGRPREHALEEYKEAAAFMRHDDQLAWTILGLTATIAFAVWAYTFKDVPVWSARALVLAFLGVLTLSLGRLMARRVTAHTESRKLRVAVLERELGFELLSRLGERMPKMSLSINRTLDCVALAAVAAWVTYFVVFLVRRF